MNAPVYFAIPGPCTMQTPFEQVHAWQWLNANRPELVTLHGYLEALGFRPGVDFLNPVHAQVLRHTLAHWSWRTARGLET